MTFAAKPAPRAAARPPGKQRLRLWLRILRATRAIEADLRERLRVQYQMTLPQFDVMAALARAESGMTMTELSRKLSGFGSGLGRGWLCHLLQQRPQ